MLKRDYGALNADKMIHIANQIPIRGGNVVNVVYDATALQLWISYAKGDQEAYRRPYTRIDLKKLESTRAGRPIFSIFSGMASRHGRAATRTACRSSCCGPPCWASLAKDAEPSWQFAK